MASSTIHYLCSPQQHLKLGSSHYLQGVIDVSYKKKMLPNITPVGAAVTKYHKQDINTQIYFLIVLVAKSLSSSVGRVGSR